MAQDPPPPARGTPCVRGFFIGRSRPAAAPARRLADHFDRPRARRALEAFGPAAEKAVLPYLSDKEKDRGLRIEACHVLQTIGTRDSTAALEAVTRSAGPLDRDLVKAANEALAAIAARPGQGS